MSIDDLLKLNIKSRLDAVELGIARFSLQSEFENTLKPLMGKK